MRLHKANIIRLWLLLSLLHFTFCARAAEATNKTVLKVALFGYIPDGTAVENQLEKKFEAANPECDLQLTLLDPYHDEDEGMPSLQHFKEFDVVETDLCRLDDLAGSKFGIDGIPTNWVWYPSPEKCVAGAKIVVGSEQGRSAVPHWICENFAVTWVDNKQHATNDDAPVLGDFWGSTGLGEFYANALVDLYGVKAAEDQLRDLAKAAEKDRKLDPNAKDQVLKLISRVPPHFRSHLPYYHSHGEQYGSLFGSKHDAMLVGYSESLFFSERTVNELNGEAEPRHLGLHDVAIRPLTIGTGKGTPSWVDGFVIPKDKLEPKKDLIEKFLLFIMSREAYSCFASPEPHFASANLLPAYAIIYDDPSTVKEEPLLPAFREKFDGSFPVLHSDLWRGMKNASKLLQKEIPH